MQGMTYTERKIPSEPRSMISGYLSPSLHGRSKSFKNPIEETLFREIERLLYFLIDSKTSQEFCEASQKVFPEYYRLVMASTVVCQTINVDTSLGKIEKYFIDNHKSSLLDKEQCKRILFNIGTIKRSHTLIKKIISIPPTDSEKDKDLADLYSRLSSWVQMHIGCLILAINKKHGLPSAVLEELLNGSDVAAAVYSIAREAVDLREGLLQNSPQHDKVIWDKEDEIWANAS